MGPLGVVVAVSAMLLACLPEAKEVVDFPPVTSTLRAELIGQLGDGMRDVRSVRTSGDRLYAADETGLYIYDISSAEAPSLAGTITDDGRVDQVAFLDAVVYLIEVNGDSVREWDVTDPALPVEHEGVFSVTRSFGGVDARDGLVWHAVGSSPPSRIFYGQRPLSLDSSCLAEDRERGVMNVWLQPGLVILSIHFDDFAGDDLDGNGGYGFALLELDARPAACPRTRVTDTMIIKSHALNRSEFEESTNSDLQASYDSPSRSLYLTGGQRLVRARVGQDGRVTRTGEIAIPELLDVEVGTPGDGLVLGLANGDFALVDDRDGELAYAGSVETPGIARAIATRPVTSPGARTIMYVADGTSGVAVISVEDSP